VVGADHEHFRRRRFFKLMQPARYGGFEYGFNGLHGCDQRNSPRLHGIGLECAIGVSTSG